ncbi:TIGR03013 family XrtA/PEP-CTERM system glycosyltransferase [Alteraurantiacibacter aquimixticola]|uniref:TIGR03013 family PEP-CTERM/XrtA system glycosyltransferase n=1 Tax=Alteraurantiacibacter aquimixticola TaxID=2489173 RepID=A0A4T3EZX3_9SPHN|nr:TIGR03013 family XrtA/PEP-CTERM system glycosyltransferase [Alteraurantiacibacter aquimixticola]TIX50204.1 TIGR03013 family PEP-CTERM/XrtA system glycosyltransferase [Alteraurantiacibacter aquimixticola]
MIRLFKHYVPHAVLLLGLIDFVLLLGANNLAWLLRAGQIGMDPGSLLDRLPTMGFISVVTMTAMIAVGVFGADALRSMRFAGARLLVAVSLAVLGLGFLDFILPGQTWWRSILLYAMGLSIVFLMANRLIVGGILGASAFRRRVLVLGAGDRARRLRALGLKPESGFSVVGFVSMGAQAPVIEEAIPRSAIDDLSRHVATLGASEVVLALEERRNALPLKDLLRIKTLGVHVNDFSSFMERETGRVDLDTLNPSWLIFSDGFSSGRAVSSAVKRIFDVLASLVLLVLTLPVIATFALLVKLDSKGPAFFRQTRIGIYGQRFTLVKLRSMRADAEKDGAKWAEKADPRITRIGAFIRKLRIDELPQVWTVLKGEMSFVGPRPEVPQFVSDLEEKLPFYAERHMVKPGITGWAQINYPYGASIEDARRKLEYDLYYAKNYTPFLDLLILLQTMRVILWPEGAR